VSAIQFEGRLHRIYLDNAATSFPKPDAVYAAIDEYNRRSLLRSARGLSGCDRSAAIAQRCRKKIADLLMPKVLAIVFTFNGTDSLNLALHGLFDRATTSSRPSWTIIRSCGR
jgi:selenocysteine lyase/cysteine desulfurase